MSIVFVGIDLAKNEFADHGVAELGKPAPVRTRCGGRGAYGGPNAGNSLEMHRAASRPGGIIGLTGGEAPAIAVHARPKAIACHDELGSAVHLQRIVGHNGGAWAFGCDIEAEEVAHDAEL